MAVDVVQKSAADISSADDTRFLAIVKCRSHDTSPYVVWDICLSQRSFGGEQNMGKV